MRIIVCDRNVSFVEAARPILAQLAEIHEGDITALEADAVVSPANSFGFMDGGVDYAYSLRFGWDLQDRLRNRLAGRPFGELLVGEALVVPTYDDRIPYLVSAPTMRVPKIITDPADIMLATRAATRVALEVGLSSLAFPGMGTGCGRVPPDAAARAMRAGLAAGLTHNLNPPRNWPEAQRRHFALEG